MKLFVMMCLLSSSVSLSAFGGEVDCKNIAQDGQKDVSCEKLAAAEKAKCEAARAVSASGSAVSVH